MHTLANIRIYTHIFINYLFFDYIIVLFALLDLSFSTNTMHKLYDKSIGLKCPGCDSDQCPISINGVNTTIAAAPGYSIQNGQLIVPSHDWDVYGTYRCEGLDKQLFYTICPTGKVHYIANSVL